MVNTIDTKIMQPQNFEETENRFKKTEKLKKK